LVLFLPCATNATHITLINLQSYRSVAVAESYVETKTTVLRFGHADKMARRCDGVGDEIDKPDTPTWLAICKITEMLGGSQ